jgi:hypothetical protein
MCTAKISGDSAVRVTLRTGEEGLRGAVRGEYEDKLPGPYYHVMSICERHQEFRRHALNLTRPRPPQSVNLSTQVDHRYRVETTRCLAGSARMFVSRLREQPGRQRPAVAATTETIPLLLLSNLFHFCPRGYDDPGFHVTHATSVS